MFLERIGKARHKYKAKFILTKAIDKSSEKGNRFCVKVERYRILKVEGPINSNAHRIKLSKESESSHHKNSKFP